ncbi:hypothetical protein [Siphonobacter aquaeclarae]|uniref:Uncharacterized protein n=1 Tax=Siphonobacter aquaeclarae TaxID=563176 RepID=A0A1G9T0Q1_9BACT|nr:hypothetical protein [Siphonobacter aquaeclarae]SDM41279.1 hypothetical protein SAMN04488090_3368 [Siphonobacter aquaeclarae]
MKYEIRINGQAADLPPGLAVKLDWQNPYLRYDTIPGSADTMPALPPTAKNQRLFGYFHQPQAGGRIAEYTCQHFYGGELLKEGYFILTEADEEKGYSGVFSDKLGEFFGDYQKTRLNELPLGTLPAQTPSTGEVFDGGKLAYVLPTIVNPDFFGGNTPEGWTGKVNDYDTGAYLEGTPVVPCFLVTYVLRRLAQLTGTTITGDLFTDPVFSRLVIYNTRALDGAATVSISQHLPELTVQEFLLELRKLPNLAYTFNGVAKTLRIDFWDRKLEAPTVLDWSDKAVKGGPKTAERSARLHLSYEMDGGDALAKDRPGGLADYLTPELPDDGRNGLAKVTSKFSTLTLDAASGLAAARQKGITSQYGQGAEKFAPRLLFWNGVVSGLPRALPTYGGQTLYWTGLDGLAARCWKNLEGIRAGWFYLKKDLVLNEADLATLDFSRKVHIDGVDYLVASVSASLPLHFIVNCLLISC